MCAAGTDGAPNALRIVIVGEGFEAYACRDGSPYEENMMDWAPHDPQAAGGVAISMPTRAGLLDAVAERLQAGQGFSIATLNLDHVVKLRRDPVFRRAYSRHTHVVADGNPIVWLSRLAGSRVELVPGSELIDPVAGIAARQEVPVALVGSTDASLSRAADALVARHPGLRIVARIAPAMGFNPEKAEADAVIGKLEESGVRLCLLALGAPKQEIFAARAQDLLPATGFLSIGAGLDFISGRQTRAPAVVRTVAAEWLWRLAGDPQRLVARYGACIAILPNLAVSALRARVGRGAPVRQ